MAVTSIREPIRNGEYLVSEAEGSRSREVGVITGGVDLIPGTVLGRITASGKYAPLAPAASDGTQTAAAILWGRALASGGDLSETVNVRDCEVNGLVLTWPTGITVNQQSAAILQLASTGVIVRT